MVTFNRKDRCSTQAEPEGPPMALHLCCWHFFFLSSVSIQYQPVAGHNPGPLRPVLQGVQSPHDRWCSIMIVVTLSTRLKGLSWIFFWAFHDGARAFLHDLFVIFHIGRSWTSWLVIGGAMTRHAENERAVVRTFKGGILDWWTIIKVLFR